MMDKPGSHKSEFVRVAIKVDGVRLRLMPPDSPDFNPSEQVFARLKLLQLCRLVVSSEILFVGVVSPFHFVPSRGSPIER